MTVAELILELRFQPQNLDVFLSDGKKSKTKKQHKEFNVQFCSPEYADNYVSISFNYPKTFKH